MAAAMVRHARCRVHEQSIALAPRHIGSLWQLLTKVDAHLAVSQAFLGDVIGQEHIVRLA